MNGGLFVATHHDGSQTLVRLWNDDEGEIGEVATRPDRWATWGIPIPLEVTR